jgi:hypothetical protein
MKVYRKLQGKSFEYFNLFTTLCNRMFHLNYLHEYRACNCFHNVFNLLLLFVVLDGKLYVHIGIVIDIE